jgi:S1-C subfamily serine protease
MIRLETKMKRAIALLIPALMLAVAPATAGDDGTEKKKKKCAAEVTECIRQMASELKKRGWIGIEWQDTEGRPRITHVVAGSPAATAGVQVGDVVTAFNGVPGDSKDEVLWAEMKRSLVPGKVATLAVTRDGKAMELRVELIAVPDHILAQWVGKHVLERHVAPADDEAPARP